MSDKDDDVAYERFRRREANKLAAANAKVPTAKDGKKHIDLRKKFCLGDLIRFSQFPDEDESIVATVIGYGKAYSILVGWRMGEKVPQTHHGASWELAIEPTMFVNDWRMFVRMTWITLPNDQGIIIDPRQPTKQDMDDAIDMLNEIKLLHFSPSDMEKYNHILDMKRSVLGKFAAAAAAAKTGLVDAIKNEDNAPKVVQVQESKA